MNLSARGKSAKQLTVNLYPHNADRERRWAEDGTALVDACTYRMQEAFSWAVHWVLLWTSSVASADFFPF
jgi:hypothetical protein